MPPAQIRAVISVKQGTTDLTAAIAADEAFISQTGKFGFGSGGGGAGGGGAQDLQATYNLSADPEILTDSTRGAVTFRRGSVADTDNVFEVENNAGAKNFQVTGQGNVSLAGTLDGRDIDTDGTKLDTIETNADVTDETNVVSSLDGATIANITVATGDKVLLQDISDTDNLKTATAQSIADLFNLVTDTTPQLGGVLDSNSNQIQASKGANVASATALPLGSDGNFFNITGTTTITSISTKKIGTHVTLQFAGILTLTHNATDLILPTTANIVTAAGDTADFVEFATGDWVCVSYTRADGTPLAGGGSTDTDNNQTGTAYTLVLADGDTDATPTTVWMSDGSANTLTIPTNASVAFATGSKLNVIQEGAGQTTILGDTGVTVNGVSAGSVVINNQYQGAVLSKRGTNTWIISGDIT